MTAPAAVSRSHVLQLDGLRGCAVLLVLVEHFTFNEWIRSWSPGSVGVRTFFVLSGYLITGILLSDRDRFDAREVARRFFRNRALRLLPPFLVAVALAALLDIADMREDWLWHVTYLSNLEVMLEARWTGAGHFWTLAVEQQFYILWFPLVVLLPRRWLLPMVVAMIVGAPLFRGLIVAGRSEFIDVLFPAQVDALALGALMAVAMRSDRGKAAVLRLGHPLATGGLVGLAVALHAPWPGFDRSGLLAWVVAPSVTALAAASVISRALARPDRSGVLTLPILTGLGRISYGLYLFHYFVPQAFNLYVPFVAGLTEGPEKVLRLVIWTGVSVALAAASWRWIEKPALRLKSGFGRRGRQGLVERGTNDSEPRKSRATPSSFSG